MSQITYFRSGEIIEITIKDNTGKKLESHHIPLHDKVMYRKVMGYIENKYDLKFKPEIPENSFI